MHLPLDYTLRFPEWFTTQVDRRYVIRDVNGGTERTVPGKQMQSGVTVELKPGVELRWRITAD